MKNMNLSKEKVKNIHGVEIGDIFYTSWGYDQTNIDFFEVVAVTEKMATVKPIREKRTETGWLRGETEPMPGEYITGNGYRYESIKTKTENYGINGNHIPQLNNADGHNHAGFKYDGGKIDYTAYA